MVFERSCLVLADDAPRHGNARTDHRVAIAADEIVPVRQRAAFGAQAIGAGPGQPADIVDDAQRQPQAIRDEGLAVLVIHAACGLRVEQPAGDIGVLDLAGVFIFDLVQAAASATVAQGFPFRRIEIGQRPLPETVPQRTHFSSSAATASGPSSVGSMASGSPSGPNR